MTGVERILGVIPARYASSRLPGKPLLDIAGKSMVQRVVEQAKRSKSLSAVVVTHYAPSLRSADPRYGLTPGTAGFCNALDDMLPLAQWWLHGHLHAPSDYTAQGCRVIANPLGYARKNEQLAFKPHSLIEVGV